MNATAKSIDNAVKTNRFANLWLVSLMAVLGLTAMVTAVLVAWPLVAYIGSRLFG